MKDRDDIIVLKMTQLCSQLHDTVQYLCDLLKGLFFQGKKNTESVVRAQQDSFFSCFIYTYLMPVVISTFDCIVAGLCNANLPHLIFDQF